MLLRISENLLTHTIQYFLPFEVNFNPWWSKNLLQRLVPPILGWVSRSYASRLYCIRFATRDRYCNNWWRTKLVKQNWNFDFMKLAPISSPSSDPLLVNDLTQKASHLDATTKSPKKKINTRKRMEKEVGQTIDSNITVLTELSHPFFDKLQNNSNQLRVPTNPGKLMNAPTEPVPSSYQHPQDGRNLFDFSHGCQICW